MTITCIDSNSGISNNIKPIIGWVAVALAVAAVAFYVIAPHISFHGIQHFMQTINQVKYMPYYVVAGAFSLISMGIIAIIKSIKEKEKGNLIFEINNETILTLPKEIKHDVTEMNRVFKKIEKEIEKGYKETIKRSKCKKLDSEIRSTEDEVIKKRLKFIFSNDAHISSLLTNELQKLCDKQVPMRFEEDYDKICITHEGKKVKIPRKLIIEKKAEAEDEGNERIQIKCDQILYLDSSRFTCIKTKFKKL